MGHINEAWTDLSELRWASLTGRLLKINWDDLVEIGQRRLDERESNGSFWLVFVECKLACVEEGGFLKRFLSFKREFGLGHYDILRSYILNAIKFSSSFVFSNKNQPELNDFFDGLRFFIWSLDLDFTSSKSYMETEEFDSKLEWI